MKLIHKIRNNFFIPLIIIMLVFFEYSCSKKKKAFYLLSGGEYKFWYEQISTDKDIHKYFYYFDKFGNWLIFKRFYVDKRFEKLNTGDVIRNEYWELIDEKTIDMGGGHYIIEKLNRDEFIVSSLDSFGNYIAKFVSAPDSLIPKEFRKLHNGRKGYNYSNEYKK